MVWVTASSGGCLSVAPIGPVRRAEIAPAENLRRGVVGRGILGRANLVDLVTQSKSPTPQKGGRFAHCPLRPHNPWIRPSHHGERDASQLFPRACPSGAAVERGGARAGVAYTAADQARDAVPA